MRRPLFMLPAPTALAALAALGALGCEDGPAQTYQASPPGAGTTWNGGTTPPAAADAGQGFSAAYPTQSKTVLCSTDFKRKRWAWMLAQPIIPPRKYAGLDMALNDNWDGLTIDAAESPPSDPNSPTGGLCQSNPFGYEGACPSGYGGCNGNAWGDNQEVFFSWNVATHLVDQMELSLGYTGVMQTDKYFDHNGEEHAYTVGIGDVIRRDGQPFLIDWAGNPNPQITDIFNATMATFAPAAGVPFDTTPCTDDSMCTAAGTTSVCECAHVGNTTACDTTKNPTGGKCGIADCGADGNCLIQDDGSNTYFGIRPMVVYIVGNAGVPQPALSTPNLIYNFFSKWEPFSNLPQVVKLDAEGPVAQGVPIGDPTGKVVCTQKIGLTFDDMRKNCIQVTGNTTVDGVNLNKVEHSLVHDQEHWTANVLGVNQNFTSLKVLNNPDLVVQDNDTPQPGDIAQDFTFDVRARGHIVNDYKIGADQYTPGAGNKHRGSAMVFAEWARLLLNDMAPRLKAAGLGDGTVKTLGDPTCTGFDANNAPNYKSSTGCTGIEGMIIPAGASFSKDPNGNKLIPPSNYDLTGFVSTILKPGNEYSAFCIDPGVESDCTSNPGWSMFQNALQHVTRVLGGGDVLNLPSELRDRRYYFKWFGVAYVKYLKAYGNYYTQYGNAVNNNPTGVAGGGLGPTDVMNQQIDLESLFFDYLTQPGAGGAQTFDKFEYVDRDFIGQGSGGAYNWIPWDFEYGCDLFGGNQRYDNWYRRMDREEVALYSSMLTDKTHTPGQENNVNITNLFGNLILGGDANAAIAGVWPSYLCAIGQAGDPAVNCVSGFLGAPVTPPLDPSSSADPCGSGNNASGCNGTQTCAASSSFENGYVAFCGDPCDFTTYAASGCAKANQTCVPNDDVGSCLDMKMDKNGSQSNAHPLLWGYAGAWQRTPLGRGHSPLTLAAKDKHPTTGVAKVNIPNFIVDSTVDKSVTGPYTVSPILPAVCTVATQATDCPSSQVCNASTLTCNECPSGYTLSTNKVWCNGNTSQGTGTLAPGFAALTPWLEVQPQVGFSIPIDAQHNQFVSTGQIDFTGVLESYLVDYRPWTDPAKASCVSDGVCNTGYKCNAFSKDCETDDDTIRIHAIEGADFLGQAFMCIDPTTLDILHVGMYDSADTILDWLAAHPANNLPVPYGQPSAQDFCQILVIRSPADNYVDYIVSKTYGVSLNIGGGQGQGRVTDVVLFDPTLIQQL